jgi:hypothetical protein
MSPASTRLKQAKASLTGLPDAPLFHVGSPRPQSAGRSWHWAGYRSERRPGPLSSPFDSQLKDCSYGALTGCGTKLGQIVPRLAIWGEWDGRGEVCWKWVVLLGLNLRFFMRFYALLQRTGILVWWAVLAYDGWVGQYHRCEFIGQRDTSPTSTRSKCG